MAIKYLIWYNFERSQLYAVVGYKEEMVRYKIKLFVTKMK